MRFPLLMLLTACQPAPVEIPPAPAPTRTVMEVYMHQDGKTNCVEQTEGEWRGDPSCCPEGFSPAGFSAPAATLYMAEDKPVRRIFRHLICLQDL